MSQRTIKRVNGKKRTTPNLGSLEPLLKGVEKMKQLNDELIASVDAKLQDFNSKVNDLNARLEVLEKGVNHGDNDIGGSEEDSPREG